VLSISIKSQQDYLMMILTIQIFKVLTNAAAKTVSD